ncbi:MAG: hypothetical protein QM753_02660 [Thermomicrobiales bacterium]
MNSLVLPLSEELKNLKRQRHTTKPPGYVKALRTLHHNTLSIAALRATSNYLNNHNDDTPPTYAGLAFAIATTLEQEFRHSITNRTRLTPTHHALLASASAHIKPAKPWIALGGIIVGFFESTSLFRFERQINGNTIKRHLFADKWDTILATATPQGVYQYGGLTHIHRPMVVPPVPWEGPFGGGYLTSLSGITESRSLFTQSNTNDAGVRIQQAHDSGSLNDVYSAVNVLQSTPWSLNMELTYLIKLAHLQSFEPRTNPDRELYQLYIDEHRRRANILRDAKEFRERRRSIMNQLLPLHRDYGHGGTPKDCETCKTNHSQLWNGYIAADESYRRHYDAYRSTLRRIDRLNGELANASRELKSDQGNLLLQKHLDRLRDELSTLRNSSPDSEKYTYQQLRLAYRTDSARRSRLRALVEECDSIADLAERLSLPLDQLAIFFPYHLDYRGRAYASSSGLSPQGDDKSRSVLQFHKAQPLTTSGEHWLAVHLANTYGLDKLTFDQRYQWVLDHREQIASLAESAQGIVEKGLSFFEGLDVDDRNFWASAPQKTVWQFLAACMEWHRCINHHQDTRLPVRIDASANGLQHLAAISRDPKVGLLTNLVSHPDGHRSDIYQYISDLLINECLIDGDLSSLIGACHTASHTPIQNIISRNLVKKTVMTIPYDATFRSINDQIESYLDRHFHDKPDIDCFSLARKLSDPLHHIIHEEIKGPIGVRSILKASASLAAKGDTELLWITPIGIPLVIANYHRKRVQITWHDPDSGRRRSLESVFHDPRNLRDSRQDQRSVSANFVHSLDAAHMMRTVNRLHHAFDLTSIVVVHDSFGTHANVVSDLQHVLREEFFHIHSKNPLIDFISAQVQSNSRSPLDSSTTAQWNAIWDRAINLTGDLVLDSVLNSEYMFS